MSDEHRHARSTDSTGAVREQADDRPIESERLAREPVAETEHTHRQPWPVSNYLVSLSILLFCAVGIALFFEDRPLANTLTMYAFYALAGSVAIRVVETAIGEPLSERYGYLSRRAESTVDAAVRRSRSNARTISDALTDGDPEESTQRDRQTERRWLHQSERRESLGLTIPLTFGGVLLVVGWLVFDAFPMLSPSFLGPWLLALTLLTGVYVVLARGGD